MTSSFSVRQLSASLVALLMILTLLVAGVLLGQGFFQAGPDSAAGATWN